MLLAADNYSADYIFIIYAYQIIYLWFQRQANQKADYTKTFRKGFDFTSNIIFIQITIRYLTRFAY